MSSVREQVLDAMVAAWNTDTPVGVPELRRAPFYQIDATAVCADLYWLADEEQPDSRDQGQMQMHHLAAVIEGRAVGSLNDLPEVKLDPVYVWASRVFNDNRLGGLTDSLRVAGCEMQRGGEEKPAAKVLIALSAKYTSRVSDAEKRA